MKFEFKQVGKKVLSKFSQISISSQTFPFALKCHTIIKLDNRHIRKNRNQFSPNKASDLVLQLADHKRAEFRM
jgi:hypothetical protein